MKAHQKITVRDPLTAVEWQDAVNTAELMLTIDACEQYGLITGPKVNVARCEWILAEGLKRNIKPNRKPEEMLRG